jgi:hypothetical protein
MSSLRPVAVRVRGPGTSVFAVRKEQHGDVVKHRRVLNVEGETLIVAAPLNEPPSGVA